MSRVLTIIFFRLPSKFFWRYVVLFRQFLQWKRPRLNFSRNKCFASIKGQVFFTIRRAEKFLKLSKNLPKTDYRVLNIAKIAYGLSQHCAPFFRKTIVWSKRITFNIKTFSAWEGIDSFKLPFGH